MVSDQLNTRSVGQSFYAQLAGVTISTSCPRIKKNNPILNKNGFKLVAATSFVEVELEGELRKLKAESRLYLMNSKIRLHRSENLS